MGGGGLRGGGWGVGGRGWGGGGGWGWGWGWGRTAGVLRKEKNSLSPLWVGIFGYRKYLILTGMGQEEGQLNIYLVIVIA